MKGETTFYRVYPCAWTQLRRNSRWPPLVLHRFIGQARQPRWTFCWYGTGWRESWMRIAIPQSFWEIIRWSTSCSPSVWACFLRRFWEFTQSTFTASASHFCRTKGRGEWSTCLHGRHPKIDPYSSSWVTHTYAYRSGRCSLGLRDCRGTSSTWMCWERSPLGSFWSLRWTLYYSYLLIIKRKQTN